MSKKDKKKGNQVVRDMKECFRSFDLPVNQDKSIKDNPMNVAFTSQICNDHVCAGVAAEFDRQQGYVGIDISFCPQVPAEKMAEISELLNLLNGNSPIYGYSVCHCCNTVSMRTALFLSGKILPKGKFKRLIHEMLDVTYLFYPLIAEVIKSGNPETLYDRFIEDHRDALNTGHETSEGVEGEILADMESVMNGMKMTITEDRRVSHGFLIDCKIEGTDLPLRMGIILEQKIKTIILCIGPPLIVPDEKIPVMTELVNRINRVPGPTHLFINRQTKHTVLSRGIMIDHGALDKQEFEMSIRTLMDLGSLLFPIINEQLSSNDAPEVLLARLAGNSQNSH